MSPHLQRRRARHAGFSAVGVALALLAVSCNTKNDDNNTPGLRAPRGVVLTSWGAAVVGARVFLVPATSIVTTRITSADVLSRVAEAYDEPLEDLIRSTLAQGFPQATTGANGSFTFPTLDTTKSYFAYVSVNGATPANLYPGGNLSRVALSGAALQTIQIELTGHPTAAAKYVGSSTCLTCHQEYVTQKTHAHRLGFRTPGVTTQLQSLERHPGFDDGLAFFKTATPQTFQTQATSLWLHGYTGTRGFDKFIVSDSLQAGSEVRLYLWKQGGTYKITMENLVNTEAMRTFDVGLTYGGALYKQRYMVKVDNAAYAGHYPFLQYQHAGDDSYYDRTRRVWRDYHMDFFWDAAKKMFKDPSKSKTIEANCMACHATGYRYFDNKATGERLCDAVNDPAGAGDIDGDGTPDELNTGCEVCHGPGSEHVAARRPEFIVKPQNLSPSRESQICGRCHDRVAGNDDRKNDQPLNTLGDMPMPGISRADFLENFTSRKGPKMSSFWADGMHSKSHHQQYPDFIKSAHYRNSRRLVVCSDCHDLHGKGGFDGNLEANPADGSLCMTCHATENISDHLLKYTGSRKAGSSTSCMSCHYTKTAKTGAGRRGLLLGPPTGKPSDAEITYWQNDISSHHTMVPRRTNVGVRGKTPGSAMPVPYVNRCATCHDARYLKYQK